MQKRRNGQGSIVKRKGRYYLRGINPSTGKYTMRGLDATDADAAKEAAKPLLEEWRRLAKLEEREEAILQLAKTRKLIAEEKHGLDDIWRLYLDAPTRPQGTTPARLEDERRTLGKFIGYCRAHVAKTPSAITPELAQGYLNAVERDLSPRSYNAHRGMLRPVFAHTWRVLGLDADPFADVRARRAVTQSRRELTPEQIASILDYINGAGWMPEPRAEYRLLVLLGIYTGARLKDACLLRWEDVDLGTGVIVYTPAKTRRSSGKEVKIHIHRELLPHLLGARGQGGCVCPRIAERYQRDKQGVSKNIQRIIHAATGLEITAEITDGRKRAAAQYGFHSFRHSAASRMIEAGVPIPLVADIVGHGNPAMTEHYYHASEEARKRAMDALNTTAPINHSEAREKLVQWAENAPDDKLARAWEIIKQL